MFHVSVAVGRGEQGKRNEGVHDVTTWGRYLNGGRGRSADQGGGHNEYG